MIRIRNQSWPKDHQARLDQFFFFRVRWFVRNARRRGSWERWILGIIVNFNWDDGDYVYELLKISQQQGNDRVLVHIQLDRWSTRTPGRRAAPTTQLQVQLGAVGRWVSNFQLFRWVGSYFLRCIVVISGGGEQVTDFEEKPFQSCRLRLQEVQDM